MYLLNLLYFFFIYGIELGFMLYITKLSHELFDDNIPSFNSITPTHKKWYVTCNLVKSVIFALTSYHSYYLLTSFIINNIWDNTQFLYLGCLYASIDMSSIILVPKLSTNTFYHHLVVNILFFYSLFTNMNPNSFASLIVIYALFSVLAFSVNFYLGLRILIPASPLLEYLSTFCFVNYLLCCLPNWSYQFYNLYFNDNFINNYSFIPRFLFCGVIMVVVYDDLVLMKYLKDHSYFKNILEDGYLNKKITYS